MLIERSRSTVSRINNDNFQSIDKIHGDLHLTDHTDAS